MIEISRVYKAKIEYKLLYSALRLVTRLDSFFLLENNKENEYTFAIDRFVIRWKRLEITKDTEHKLHRFAIAYRHNAIQGTK